MNPDALDDKSQVNSEPNREECKSGSIESTESMAICAGVKTESTSTVIHQPKKYSCFYNIVQSDKESKCDGCLPNSDSLAYYLAENAFMLVLEQYLIKHSDPALDAMVCNSHSDKGPSNSDTATLFNCHLKHRIEVCITKRVKA